MPDLNIVIPMAGQGSRFVAAGYETPKPFIRAGERTLIEIVLDNLSIEGANFILIARESHLNAEKELSEHIRSKYGAEFETLDHLTEGAAITVLSVHDAINNDTPLLLANSDQFVDSDLSAFVHDAQKRGLDGSILTFVDEKRDPKWSFARTDADGLVLEVKEKEAISEHATVGLYYFAKGRDFVDAAIDMIVQNDRVNNEFYTCPVYNYMIRKNKSIGIFGIDASEMHGLGTPSDLNAYKEKFL